MAYPMDWTPPAEKAAVGVSWGSFSLHDGLKEVLSGLGGSSDRMAQMRFEPPAPVSQAEMEWAIEFDGIFERFINAPVEDVLAEGLDFEGLGEAEEKALAVWLEEIHFWPMLFKALSVSRSNYGSMIWLDTGAKDNKKPLAKNELFRLKRLVVFDSEVIRGDYSGLTIYDEPELWSIGEANVGGKAIHRSRLLHFPGKFISDRHRHDHHGHGARAGDQIWEAWLAFRTTFLMPPNIALTYEEGVLGMQNLNKEMTTPAGRDVIRRKAFDLEAVRSFLRLRIKDAEDTFERAGAPVGGLADIMDRGENYFVAQTGFPRSILFGYSKGSNLAADSKGEEQNKLYMRLVRSIQKNILPELKRFFLNAQPVLQKRTNLPFKDMTCAFKNADTETPMEKAQRQKLEAERDMAYFAGGIGPVDRDDLRDDLKKRQVYSLQGDLPELEQPDPDEEDGEDETEPREPDAEG